MSTEVTRTDLAVIGSGATGLAAALTAAEGGAKVILFEKMRNIGGSSNFGEGMFAVESDIQRDNYIAISRDEAFKNIMEYSHWRANPRLVRAFVDESAATIAWLQRLGVEFLDVTTNMPDGPRVWHILKGPSDQRASSMIKTLAASAKGRGVDMRLDTPVKSLIKEGGKVTGVIVGEDNELQVKAKAVIVATGGYANNPEWIKKYTGFELGVNLSPMGSIEKVGDGIRMAWEAGAAEEGTGILQLHRFGPAFESGPDFAGPIVAAAGQPTLFVNQYGERYCDESIQTNFPHDGNATAKQKGKCSYTIFDESIAWSWKEKGTETGEGRIMPPGSRFDILPILNTALEKGFSGIYMASSVEELASKIGVDAAVLRSTLEEYNGFCEKGHDDLFAKDRKYLQALKGPKYMALKCSLAFLGTLGGIKINHRMEVLDRKGLPIPGLYAGGLDAGGMYGDSYDVRESGGTLAFALNSGRIAGRNASKYVSSVQV
jgi:fumarate reductase flavoprotein subunit